MRLLHTSQVRLQEFYGSNTPPYAILSHRWGEGEVLLQDILRLQGFWDTLDNEQGNASITSKEGFPKLAKAVELARRNDFEFIWVDTCCIDKTSSAELSEAINSMYLWYEKSDVCYAFLFDVKAAFEDDMYAPSSSFQLSSWFKRGWTLQELIAPGEVDFFAADWSYLGNKRETNQFTGLLSDITGIPNEILLGVIPPSEASVASRMKWAANRETTRVEDMAYSLLGIFDVNMPLLYGEGEKAFIRLQEQMLSQTDDDQTIFAWYTDESRGDGFYGLLAEHPSCFRNSGHLEPVSCLALGEPWGITSKGLKVDFRLQNLTGTSEADYYVVLNCETRDKSNGGSPIIYLKRIWVDEFARVTPHKAIYRSLPTLSERGDLETVFIKQKPSQKFQSIRISTDGMRYNNRYDSKWRVRDVHPKSSWDKPYIRLTPSDFRLNEALALLRIDVDRCGTIDVAVGLQVINRRQVRSWCVQLRADSANWLVENNFWVVNQLLRRGNVSGLSSESTEDIHGRRMPTCVTVSEHYGTRVIDLEIGIQRQPLPATESNLQIEPVAVDYVVDMAGDLEVVNPEAMPVVIAEKELRLQRPDLIRPICLDPLEGMKGLVEAYVDQLTPSGMPDWWSLCVQRGQYLHEISKSRFLPPLEHDSIHSLCYRGANHELMVKLSYGLSADADPLLGFTPLHWAVAGGRSDTITLLLRHHPTAVLDFSNCGFSVFHVAAALGHWEVFNKLVETIIGESHKLSWEVDKNARINTIMCPSTSTHDSPLHLAAGFATDLKFWLSLSSDARNTLIADSGNPPNKWGATPLHVAALTGNSIAITFLLLLSGYRTPNSLFSQQSIDPEMQQQFRPELSQRVDSVDDVGRTCVWYAAFSNSCKFIENLQHLMGLTKRSAPLDLADDNGFTPVHVACHRGHDSALASLLKCGASANTATGCLRLLPSHVAAIYGQLNCLKVLLGRPEVRLSWDQGEDPSAPSYTAISLAVANGHLGCAQLLWDRFPVPFSKVLPCVVIRGGRTFIEDLYMRISTDGFKCERVARPVHD